jgi:CRP/FNR family transcriptional regulator, cyclic AMP receptor protein
MVVRTMDVAAGGGIGMGAEPKPDIHALAAAINHSPSTDALRCQFSPAQWEVLAGYFQPFSVAGGQVLIEQTAQDRSLYFIESGSVSVHYQDDKSRVRMAMVGAGSVVGEGAFFSHQPRCATVQASGPSRLWCMTPMRFLELANRHSALALELTIAMGGVMAKRLYSRARRVAVT